MGSVAGTGVRGIDGNGGPATSAAIVPSGIEVDAEGNIYIAEFFGLVRRVSAATGIIQVAAGQGDFFGERGDGGPATEAVLGFVQDAAVDADGNLYIAANNQVRIVSGATGIINAFAGSGTRGFRGDGGPATQAGFNGVGKLTVDGQGNVSIADVFNHRIRQVTPDRVIDTVAGRPRNIDTPVTAASAQFLSPTDVAFDRDGNLYIADTENHRVRRMTPDGRVETVAGSGDGFEGDGGPATAALLSKPISVAVDSQGNIYINDSGNIRIRRVSTTGIITTIAGGARCNFPAPPPEDVLATAFPLCDPRGIAVDAGGSVYIAEWDLDMILRVRPDGTIHTLVEFLRPTDVAVDEAGNVFITRDETSGPLHRFAPDGSLTELGRGKLPSLGHLALAGDGVIYVSYVWGHQVFRVDTDDAAKLWQVSEERWPTAALEPGRQRAVLCRGADLGGRFGVERFELFSWYGDPPV